MYLHLLPITDNGAGVLRPGDEVYVISRSQRRGYLVIEHSGDHLHIPHHYTELRVSRCECGSPKSISLPLSYRSPHLTVLCSPQLRGKIQHAVIYDNSTILHTAQSEINEESSNHRTFLALLSSFDVSVCVYLCILDTQPLSLPLYLSSLNNTCLL